jgi:hypothetical protein
MKECDIYSIASELLLALTTANPNNINPDLKITLTTNEVAVITDTLNVGFTTVKVTSLVDINSVTSLRSSLFIALQNIEDNSHNAIDQHQAANVSYQLVPENNQLVINDLSSVGYSGNIDHSTNTFYQQDTTNGRYAHADIRGLNITSQTGKASVAFVKFFAQSQTLDGESYLGNTADCTICLTEDSSAPTFDEPSSFDARTGYGMNTSSYFKNLHMMIQTMVDGAISLNRYGFADIRAIKMDAESETYPYHIYNDLYGINTKGIMCTWAIVLYEDKAVYSMLKKEGGPWRTVGRGDYLSANNKWEYVTISSPGCAYSFNGASIVDLALL